MTMRTIITMSLLGCVLATGACDQGGGDNKADKQAKADANNEAKAPSTKADGKDEKAEEPAAPALDPKVEKAVTVANQISANPGEADTILADAGMDRDGFEALLYEIAKDPELSKSYAVARDA